jgi:hypothetical protein
MADKKISALTGATTPLAGTEVLPIVQSGSTVKVAVSDLTAGRAVSMTDLTATNGLFSTSGVSVGLKDTQAYSAGAPAPTLYFQGLDSSSSNTTFGTIVGKPNVGNADRGYLNLNTRVNGVSTLTTQFGTGLSADVNINAGNIIQGTAAKGINFTANTPAAGMTSQLLNWYEEGTWTPTWTSLTVIGTPTYTGRYVRVGKVVYCQLEVVSTTSTASTANTTSFIGLPFTQQTLAPFSTMTAVNNTNVTSYGVGLVNTSVGYTPTWAAASDVVLSFSYIAA